MTFDLIVSQGRIADRTPGAIRGAALTARALEPLIDSKRTDIDGLNAFDDDDWGVIKLINGRNCGGRCHSLTGNPEC